MDYYALKFQVSGSEFKRMISLFEYFKKNGLQLSSANGNSESVLEKRVEMAAKRHIIVDEFEELKCNRHNNSRFVISRITSDGVVIYVCEKCLEGKDYINASEAYYCPKCEGFVNAGPEIKLDGDYCHICEKLLVKQ